MSKRDYQYEAGGMEWLYNSVFPLQQAVYRGIRVAQDDEVDFWDKEGFGDMSLIPILGLWDDERHDVSVEEMKKRVGVKGGGFWKDFGTAVLTDPMTYMSVGAAPLMKLIYGGTKAMRTTALSSHLSKVGISAKAIADGSAKISNKALLESIEQVLKKPKLGMGKGGKKLFWQRRALKKARKEIIRNLESGAIKGGDDFLKASQVARKQDVFLGLPFGMGPRGMRLVMDTDKRFWTSYLASSGKGAVKSAAAPVIRATAPAFAGIAGRFPSIGNTFARAHEMGKVARDLGGIGWAKTGGVVAGHLGAAAGGFKGGRFSETMTTSNLDPSKMAKLQEKLYTEANNLFNGLMNPETGASRQIRSVIKDFKTVIGKEGREGYKRAFLKAVENKFGANPTSIAQPALGSELLDEKFSKYMQALLGPMSAEDLAKIGPDDIAEIINGNVHRFRREWKNASKAMADSFDKIVDSSHGKFKKELTDSELNFYKVGRKTKQLGSKVFKASLDIAELDEANRALNVLKTQSTNQLLSVGQKLMGMQVEDAVKMGMDPEKFESFMMGVAQGTPRMEEITQFIKLMNGGELSPEDYTKVASSLDNFLHRMTSLIDTGTIQAGSGRDTEVWRELVAELGTRFGKNIKYDDFDYTSPFARNRWAPPINRSDAMPGIEKNKIVVPKEGGKHRGKMLGELTDDELLEVSEKLSSKMPSADLTPAKLDKFYAGNPAIRSLQNKLGLNSDSMHRLLVKSQTGSPTYAMQYSGIPGTKPRNLGKISAEDTVELQKLAKGEIAPKLAKDKRKLPTWAKVLGDDIEEIQKWRAAGTERVRKNVEGRAAKDLEVGTARIPGEIRGKSRTTGKEVELNDLGLAVGRLRAISSELKRISSLDDASIGPSFIRELESSLEFVSKTWDEATYTILKPKGATQYIDSIRKIQRATLIKAVEHGNFKLGMPFAYVGRIFSNADSATLREMVVRAGKEEEVQAIIPMLSSNLKRNWDSATLEELNDFYYAVKAGTHGESKAVNEFAKAFEKASAKVGFELSSKNNKFVDTLFHPTVHRHAQSLKETVNIGYSTRALEAITESNSGWAGKIIGHVRDGKEHIFGTSKKTRSKIEDFETTIGIEIKNITDQSTGILVEEMSGKLRFLPMNSLTEGGYKGILLDEGDNIGAVLGLRATKGALTNGEVLAHRLSTGKLKDIAGKNLVFGQEEVINGVFNSMAQIHRHSGEFGIMMDHLQFMIKKFQTVLRPAFTVANIASLPSQLAVIGVKPLEAMGAMADSFRFLSTDMKTIGRYERTGLHAGSKKGFFSTSDKNINLRFLEDVDNIGLDQIAKLTPEELFAKYGDDFTLGEMEWHMGNGMVLSMEDMVESWSKTNMFSNFTREGLIGNQGVTYATIQIWNRALGKGGSGTRLSKMAELGKKVPIVGKPIVGAGAWYGRNVTRMAEASEVFVRLTAYFAELRMGKTMMEAAENAKIAAVDYSNLSHFERTVLKRLIPYYTFPRHFLPAAGRWYAEAPSRVATQAHLINEGPWREERGRLMFDVNAFGNQYTMDATRMLPHLEALKTLETAAEIFMDVGDKLPIGLPFLESGVVSRREKLKQGTPFPMTAGSLLATGMVAISGDMDESSFSELADAFWVNRFVFSDDDEDPLGEETYLTKFRKLMVPVRDKDPEQERAMVRRRLRLMTKRVENRIARATADQDWEERDSLMKEKVRLVKIARNQLVDITTSEIKR